MRALSTLLASLALSLGGLASAQTTHTVLMNGFTFSETDLTICEGDSVQWTWVSGFHNVESGVNGVHDGIFRSGDLETSIGQSWTLTFDFLIPNDPGLCGRSLSTQGLCLGAPGQRFSNALDARAGL